MEDKRPKVPDGGGSGVSAQRDRVPGDQMPFVQHTGKGQGVQQQRDKMPGMGIKVGGKGVQQQRVAVRDGRPQIAAHHSGQGVNMQRTTLHGDGILDGSRLRPWFRAIAERLARCIILNRSWESALTDSVLQQTPSSPKPSVGVFLDPPYRTTRADGSKKRSTGLYQGDKTGASDALAKATYEWATEGRNKLGERYADKYRIAYCMHEGDWPVPDGWTVETMSFSGHRDAKKKEDNVDCVIFSPACVPVPTDPQLGFGW